MIRIGLNHECFSLSFFDVWKWLRTRLLNY